jgi:hypothetical protein
MAQRQLPDGSVVDALGGRQIQLPDGGVLSEPSADVSVIVPAGALTLTGYAPSVSLSDNALIAVPAGALTLAGHAPVVSVTSPQDIVVPHGTLTLTAYPPFVSVRDPLAVRSTPTPRRPGLLLTDDLPFAMTTELGAFAEAMPLAQRYGDLRRTRFKLTRMTSTKFIAAGHPMEITRAFTGDLQTKSFAATTQTLGGRTFTQVEFAAPVPLGTACSASGLGKRHAVTGALIETAADIATDILTIAGRDDRWFDLLRSEAASIVLAGSFSTVTSIRAAIDVVMDSVGAIWCPGVARLYPVPLEGFRIDLDATNFHDLEPQSSIIDTADTIRVNFDFDEVEDRNQSFVELEASPQRYGGKRTDVNLPMVRSTALADSIGRRLLAWYAGERYTLAGRVNLADVPQGGEFVRPGTWATVTDHPQWPYDEDPDMMLTKVTLRGRANFATVVGEVLRTAPTITLTKHSLGSNSIGSGGIEITVHDGIAELVLLDENDKPLAGAYVSLDGAAAKKTDAQGSISFVVTESGSHHLDISAPGYASTEAEFIV